MAKTKAPTWFKIFGHYGAMLDAMPRESVGEGLVMAVKYFNTGELPETDDPAAYAVFATLKIDVDNAFTDYADSVRAGKQGAFTRWNK